MHAANWRLLLLLLLLLAMMPAWKLWSVAECCSVAADTVSPWRLV